MSDLPNLPSTLLVIDDEPGVRYSLERALTQEGRRVVCAGTAREGLLAVRQERPDAVLLDVQLPDRSGLDTLEEIRVEDRRLPVIIITAHGTADTAIEAMKRGAFDYILKPWKLSALQNQVQRAVEAGRICRVPAVLDVEPEADDGPVDRIIGRSPAMQEVYKEIGLIARQNVTVLILGESGTGKELVARAIYQHSTRASQPFHAINCAAIPETLLESELFGHEKGAFTGADRRRIGKFEQADGGTLMLDEIGDMSAATQAKVLRVLQDGRFERVGGSETVATNVRLIAATNKDLEAAIQAREFRQDLFYRLNTFTIRLPPLRARKDDIPRLMEHFLRRYRRELVAEAREVSRETLEILQNHDWPGNVRELESAVQYAVVHATGEVITPEALPESVRRHVDGHSRPMDFVAQSQPTSHIVSPLSTAVVADELLGLRAKARWLIAQGAPQIYDAIHAEVDRALLEEVLTHTQGNQSQAADILGVSRTTLRVRMQQLGLSVERKVERAE
jgi:nitrogen regulation protein NR(I)